MTSYVSRDISRVRATKEEMDARYERLTELASEHRPCSVRHLFYRAVVDEIPGITKNHSGYLKVQRAVLHLRRDGRIPYSWVVDNSRTAFSVDVWDDVDGFLSDVAGMYRRDLWMRSPYRAEVWCESDSIAGTISEIVHKWRVPIFPVRGQSSETFAYNAVQQWLTTPWRRVVVLYIGDHDPAGLEIEKSLYDKMVTFADGLEHPPEFVRIGVTWQQAVDLSLPGTKPKKSYGFPLSVEAEALPPRLLRDMVEGALERLVDRTELETLRTVEAEEREGLLRLVSGGAR